MMPYDFADGSTEMSVHNGLETKENMHLYPSYPSQDSFLKTTSSNSNSLLTSSDLWSSNNSNPNTSTSTSSFYFPSSFDFNMSSHPSQYSGIDNSNYDYQALPDVSSSYIADPYSSQMFNNTYPIDSYGNTSSTSYPTTSIDYSSSTYLSNNDSYQQLHPMYSTGAMPSTSVSTYLSGTSIDIATDYQSSISSWDSTMMKMRSQDVTSASNSSTSCSTSASKQPCLVCHEESSGYHFGAYTCESCKAFYRRATKDPRIQFKHSCEVPLPNITKSNRKDCRACRKAKCDRVGMTAMPKDRSTRSSTTSSSSTGTTSKTSSKPSPMMVNELLEQLARDLSYDQITNSSALETLLHLLELPSFNPNQMDCHTLYMDAMRTWRNQYNHISTVLPNVSFTDTFAVLLFLFRTYMISSENEDKTNQNSKLDKLVSILQEEIQRLTGTDQRSASRLKALFMKCYVALAQTSNSNPNLHDSNQLSQSSSFMPYQQYPLYGQ